MTKKTVQLVARLQELGFTFEEAMQLRRIEMTLQRWGEMECGDGSNWGLERDEVTGKPYRVYHGPDLPGVVLRTRYAVPDREKGALKRLAVIMARHPSYVAYHQSDCRGCNVYLVPVSALQPGDKLDQVYNRGVAVCD